MNSIYLDHNATTPLDPDVLECMLPLFRNQFGNPSSIHSHGRAARVRVDEAREQVAALIGAQAGEIVFTSGGTESNNLALLGTALGLRDRGRHIITCAVEHASVINPCNQLRDLGYQVDVLPVDGVGRIDLDELKQSITRQTTLISIQHANSEVGTIQKVEEIGVIARERGILFHTDAVQSVGKIPVNVDTISADLLSISAHKIYGPKGTGALYIRRGTPPLYSIMCGGGQEKKRRGGTENVPGIAGFGKACESALGRLKEGAGQRLEKLRDRLGSKIQQAIPNVEQFGCMQSRLPNTLGLGFEGAEGETLLIGLDLKNISVSTGSACSSGSGLPSPVLTAMGIGLDRVNSSLRFSLGRSNTEEAIDRTVEVLTHLVKLNRQKTASLI